MTLIIIKAITFILKISEKMAHPLTDTVIGITLEKGDFESFWESR